MFNDPCSSVGSVLALLCVGVSDILRSKFPIYQIPFFRLENNFSKFRFLFLFLVKKKKGFSPPLPSLLPSLTDILAHPQPVHTPHTSHTTQCDVCVCVMNVKVMKQQAMVSGGSNFDSCSRSQGSQVCRHQSSVAH